jgi:RimJ/RimL family protein N-acetyltransferase
MRDRYRNNREISKQRIGIGIETIEKYQNRGYASAIAFKFLEHCKQNKIVPHWECSSDNEPSNHIAKELGFTLVTEYPTLAGKFK